MTLDPPQLAGMTWGWGAIFGLLNLLLGGGVVATWIKNRPKMRELVQTAEEKLRDDLITRVEKLEAANEKMRQEYEARISAIVASSEANQAVLRHELQNVRACFNALMMLLKRMPNPPETLAAIIADVESMRSDQMRAEALEKGAVAAAKIVATATPAQPPATAPAP
jgi:vacuolar-type H+-ATPase subunit E/Vma4